MLMSRHVLRFLCRMGLQSSARFFCRPLQLLSMGLWTWSIASIRATHSLKLAAQIATQKLLFQAENRVFHCLSKLQQDCTTDSVSLQTWKKRLMLHLLELNLKPEKTGCWKEADLTPAETSKGTHQEPDKNNLNYFLCVQSVRWQGETWKSGSIFVRTRLFLWA